MMSKAIVFAKKNNSFGMLPLDNVILATASFMPTIVIVLPTIVEETEAPASFMPTIVFVSLTIVEETEAPASYSSTMGFVSKLTIYASVANAIAVKAIAIVTSTKRSTDKAPANYNEAGAKNRSLCKTKKQLCF